MSAENESSSGSSTDQSVEEASTESTESTESAGTAKNERVEEIREAVLESTKDIVSRIKPFLMDPRGTWPRIKEENESALQFYQNFLVSLVAIKPVCVFVGYGIVDRRYGVSFFGAFAFMIVYFLVALAMPYIGALVCQKVAPMCEGEISSEDGLRLIGYSSVPMYLSGLLSLIPAFEFLGSVIALYGAYLFYLGVPVMAKVPKQNIIKFILISIGIYLAAFICLALPATLMTIGMAS